MPFGLTNASAVFMALMNMIFSPYLDPSTVVFVDDVVVCSRSKEEHEQYLWATLQYLRENQLYGTEKGDFWLEQVDFLGHIISKDGLAVDPTKIKAVVKWKILKNVSKIQSFLGLVGYYRRFIERFSTIAVPLTKLTRKSIPFVYHNTVTIVSNS